MTYTPLNDRVLIEVIEPEETIMGGLYIPDSAKEKPNEGTVLAVGPGFTTSTGTVIPVPVKVGDRIIFNKFAGQALGDNWLLNANDILAIKNYK
jgi:chaperonin GroES